MVQYHPSMFLVGVLMAPLSPSLCPSLLRLLILKKLAANSRILTPIALQLPLVSSCEPAIERVLCPKPRYAEFPKEMLYINLAVLMPLYAGMLNSGGWPTVGNPTLQYLAGASVNRTARSPTWCCYHCLIWCCCFQLDGSVS